MSNRFEIDVGMDGSGVEQGAQAAGSALGQLAGQAGLVNSALRAAVPLMVAYAGARGLGAMISAASEFESTMENVQGTVGLTDDQLNVVSESTKELAEETGQATKGIAEGYKFATSAGLDLAEAQGLVETATKASASGFGEQRELVRTATTAMNAWSDEIKSGSKFLDTLTEAAQNMDIEVQGLSESFRRVINPAGELNVELDETLSALGAVSGAVGDASKGGRMLEQLFNRLLTPTDNIKEGVETVFSSFSEFRSVIQDDGLIAGLTELRERLEENGGSLADVFNRSSRLNAALAVTADNGSRAKDIMGGLADSADNVNEAYQNSESTQRNWNRVSQRFNNLLRESGKELLPAVNMALEHSITMMDRFEQGVIGVNKALEMLESNYVSEDMQESKDELREIDEILEGMTGAGAINPGAERPLHRKDAEAISSRIEEINKSLADEGASDELLETVNKNLRMAIMPGGTRQEILNSIGSMMGDMGDKINSELNEVDERAQQTWNSMVDRLNNMKSPIERAMNQEVMVGGDVIDLSPVSDSVEKTKNDTEEASDAMKELRREAESISQGVTTIEDLENEMEQIANLADRFPGVISEEEETRAIKNVREELFKLRQEREEFGMKDDGMFIDPFGDVGGEGEDPGDPFAEFGPGEVEDDGQEDDGGFSPFGREGRGLQTRRDMRRFAEETRSHMSSALSEGIRTGFENTDQILGSFASRMARTMSDRLAEDLTSTLFNSVGNAMQQANFSKMFSNMSMPSMPSIPFFGDTPGIQEVGPKGGAAGFAPGDKFVAAQSREGLRKQVGAGGGGGQSVSVQQNLEFPVTPEEKIDRRIRRAAGDIEEKAVARVFKELESGGSRGQAARRA